MIATEAEAKMVEDVSAMVQNISQRVQDMRVCMKRGKYTGRMARLCGAIIGHDGQIAYLCMVERTDGNGYINGDCASRSYLTEEYFNVMEDEDGEI